MKILESRKLTKQNAKEVESWLKEHGVSFSRQLEFFSVERSDGSIRLLYYGDWLVRADYGFDVMTEREHSDSVYSAKSWPKVLNIRDTGLHDDMGGLGQRIYTTTGAGYETQAYVRGDLYDELKTRLEELESYLDSNAHS